MAEQPPGPHGDAGGPEESYEPIEHHPAPAQDGGESDFAPVGAEDEHESAPPATSGVTFSAREREREREHGGEGEEFEYHTGVIRPPDSPPAIEFIDVHKSFGRNHVLRGLNMGLPEDQISMILGPSGTGKSVCIKHIVGLLYPDEGDVLVHGVSIPGLSDSDLFETRKKFGVLFQDGALFGSLNLYDNVAFPLRQHTEKGEDEIADIVNRRMSEVGLGGEGEKMPNQLSGGMRKRAGFARALVLDPEIVLFDEPDSGLDPVRTALLCELIKEIHAENGGCYTVITHDIMSARRVAEHISVLWKGRIVESGPAEELFASENPFVRQFLAGEAAGPLGME
ncbi:MAG TPA: ABC transporter ATP-binding protein [Solirubrobacteraceae bacterium]|jgi:phospholipid/cholesterol/gamma-HCH transport system ATP-binding protein